MGVSRRRIVLDSSAIINYLAALGAPDGELYTTNEALAELRSELARLRAEALIASGQLRIVEPPPEAIDEVRRAASKTLDIAKLSETDISVLALALHLSKDGEVLLMTDDYAMMNVACRLGIRFVPAREASIREYREYVFMCPACRRVYRDQGDGRCPHCGAPLKLVVRRRRRVRRGENQGFSSNAMK